MPIKVMISCSSDRTDFKDCIKKLCSESKGTLEYHYIPDEAAPCDEHDRLSRMLCLVRESDIVFMDVTPAKFSHEEKGEYLTNPGVLIEYGVLVSSVPYQEKLKIFCENTVSRSLLHPYFLQTVHSYSLKRLKSNSAKDSLKRQIKALISNYRERLPELTRKQQAEIEAYKTITRIKDTS